MRPQNRKLKIFVPRLMDEANTNAQNLNAKALLARFDSPDIQWHTVYYNKPDPMVCDRENVTCHRLIRRRFWMWHIVVMYLYRYDAIFYPGNEWYDAKGLKWRKKIRKDIPIIATLEGIPGDEERETLLSELVGHKVFCFRPRSGSNWTEYHDLVRHYSSHIIAISPFLSQVCGYLYQKDNNVIPLGVDTKIFYPVPHRVKSMTVISAGTVYDAKRPMAFLELAVSFPEIEFVWYGTGEKLQDMLEAVSEKGINNLTFIDQVNQVELSKKYRESSIFVLPSFSEGVPKVTIEAAACGLPVVIFGFYESPSVLNGETGYVVWSNDELREKVGELLVKSATADKFGRRGAALAEQHDWNLIAPYWEEYISASIKGPD